MDMTEKTMVIAPLAWTDEGGHDIRALFVRDLVVAARVGVYQKERGHTQALRFNLCVYLRPPYAEHDKLADVLDYDRLRQGILDIVAAGHINLLETLGERVIDMCMSFAQTEAVHLQIAKPEAHDDCLVGYEARRRR